MNNIKKYDIAIIGGGPGGYVCAIRAAQNGKKVVVLEENRLGGICLNWGCIPTKSLLSSADIYNNFKKANFIDINDSDYKLKWDKIIEKSRSSSDLLSKGVSYLMKKNNIEIISGHASIIDNNTISILSEDKTKTEIFSKNIVIATGASPKSIPGISFDKINVITSREAMVLKKCPKSITILGGGAIGVEFAYFFKSFGSDVRLIELQERLMPESDHDISLELENQFKNLGINVHTSTKISNFNASKDRVSYSIGSDDFSSEICLIAIGLSGNINNLGLENTMIKTSNSFIEIDEQQRTSVSNIFAIGDVAGPPLLAHVASAEGKFVSDLISSKILDHKTFNKNNIPSCVYSKPEIASVGLTENNAKTKYGDIKVGKFPFSALGKAVATDSTSGFIKVIFDSNYGELLGCHIIGKNATEIIISACIARSLETTAEEILSTIHPHPTISESFQEAVADAYGEAFHV